MASEFNHTGFVPRTRTSVYSAQLVEWSTERNTQTSPKVVQSVVQSDKNNYQIRVCLKVLYKPFCSPQNLIIPPRTTLIFTNRYLIEPVGTTTATRIRRHPQAFSSKKKKKKKKERRALAISLLFWFLINRLVGTNVPSFKSSAPAPSQKLALLGPHRTQIFVQCTVFFDLNSKGSRLKWK